MSRLRISRIILVVMLLSSLFIVNAYAGSINGNEQRVISAASGPFHYGGKTYVPTGGAMSSLVRYLKQDGIDLTGEQADRAIAEINSNVKTGVEAGYIVSNDKGNGSTSGGNNSLNGNKPGTGENSAGAANSANDNDSIFPDTDAGIDSTDSNAKLKPVPIIKGTGFDYVYYFIGAIVAVALMLLAFLRKKRIFIPVCGVVLACCIVIPLADYGSNQISKVISEGNPIVIHKMAENAVKTGDNAGKLDEENTDKEDTDRRNVAEAKSLIGYGTSYGRIVSDDVKLDVPLYFGDADYIFEKGAGQYTESGLPGEGKTIIAGGHDLTYFAPLEKIKKNHIIEIDTIYGVYKYRVTGTRVAKYNDESAFKGLSGEKLVLYTCYPFGAILGERTDRFFVYATLIDKDGE